MTTFGRSKSAYSNGWGKRSCLLVVILLGCTTTCMAWNSGVPQISIHPTASTSSSSATATTTAVVDGGDNLVDETRKQSLLELFLSGCAIMGSMGIGLAGNPKASFAKGNSEFGNAIDGLRDCPGQPVKKSCWSTEDKEGRSLQPWIPPADMSSQQILQDLLDTVAQYPQTGQSDVDGGGWKLIEQSTVNDNTYIHYEFTSGKFRFIDDLEFIVSGASKGISVRSASRNGGFDYGVNATRLNYIAKLLLAKGWQVSLL